VERFATLDGMRRIAALAVALYHWGLATQPLARLGYLAVDFFFALSGFVIALNYSQRLSGGLAPGQFMFVRLVRFFPIYLAGHVFGIIQNLALLISGNPNAKTGAELVLAITLGIFMLPVPLDVKTLFPLNPPAWTLFLELLINVVFALGMFRWSSRVLALIMAASAITLILFTGAPLYFDVGYSAPTFLLGVARLGYSFPLGILIFRILGNQPRSQSVYALIPVLILTICLLFAPPEPVRGLWEIVCVFILFPALLATGIRFDLPRTAAPLFGFLGNVSFAVYAIHGPLILFVYKLNELLGLGRWSSIGVFLAVLLILSHLVSRFFDVPLRASVIRWRKKVTA
jgi:peptidoglycan/LPS O-acetylase OafA/YrhL